MCCRVLFTHQTLKFTIQGVSISSCQLHTSGRLAASEIFERGLNVNVNLITLGDSGKSVNVDTQDIGN
jgi:hypothetical protein